MDQEMSDGAGGLLHSWMSWQCPEGGLVRPRSSPQSGEQDVQGRSWEWRGKRGCARVEGPLQRGLLGVEMVPRLGVSITSGQWPPQGDSDHKPGMVTIPGGGWLSLIQSGCH